MDSIELGRLERVARGRYERARAFRAIVGFAPALGVVAAAAVLSHRPVSAALFGAALFATGAGLLWRGQTLHQAVLPGVLAGLVPLVLSLAANLIHDCSEDLCTSLCVPACASGGVVAGFVVSAVAARRGRGWAFVAGASAVSLLTGAMGCACVGYSGVVGLVAGFAVGLLPQVARRAVGRG